VVTFALRLFYYPRNNLGLPLNRWLGGPHSRSGSPGEKKNHCYHWDSNFLLHRP